MSSIWHTELNDFEKKQIFYCVFFTKKDPLLMRIGYYHPVKIKFGDYVNEYTPDKIKKFIKIDDLLDLEIKLERTRKALDKGMEHITGLNNMIESWYKLLQSDKDTSTKYAILKSAISAYVENKGEQQ